MNSELALTHDFDLVVAAAIKTVAASSRPIYGTAYARWASWCAANDCPLLPISPEGLDAFLRSLPVTVTTRKNYASALRKLAWMLALDSREPRYRALYEYLREYRVPSEGAATSERSKLALTPGQVHRLLTYFIDPQELDEPAGIRPNRLRNHLLLAVALATGARRAEIVRLEWRDLNLEDGTALIRHGKGDKERVVAFIGRFALDALAAWRQRLGEERRYVFPATGKGDHIGEDKPIDPTTYYKMVKALAAEFGIDFATHTFRRTAITEWLSMRTPLHEVQAQAGHADSSTTTKYAQAGDAKQRRETFKTRWE